MLIVLGILLVLGLLSVGAIFFEDSENRETCIASAVFITIVVGMIIIPTVIISYTNYLDDRAFYDATVGQYRDQIKVYKNEARLNVKDISYTDFKYEGYQKEIATNIRTLTNGVVCYNQSIIKKRILKKNIFFSWFITVPDDDMVVISLVEKVLVEK